MSPQAIKEKSAAAPNRPRERILEAAGKLFYRHGIRAVGVDAIAAASGTNKMTLYRHFSSKDELVAEYLQQSANGADTCWEALERRHPGDALAQLRGWLKGAAERVADCDERGCALANAAIELPDRDHPARRVIEAHKTAHRDSPRGAGRGGRAQRPRDACRRVASVAGGGPGDRAKRRARGPRRPFRADGRSAHRRARLRQMA